MFGRVNCDLALSGGVHTPVDAVKSIMSGASVAQMTSALLMNGPEYVSNMLTGGDDARLTKRLKIDKQLVQQVSSFQWSNKRNSLFIVMAYAKPSADLGEIEAIIQEELQGLTGDKPAKDDELKRALRMWEMSFLSGLESLMSRAETLQGFLFHVGKADYLDENLDRYRKVDAAKVKEAVGRYLSTDKKAVLKVLPKPKDTPEQEQEKGQ